MHRIELSIVGPITQYQCVMYPNCHIVSVVTPDSRVLALGDLRMNVHTNPGTRGHMAGSTCQQRENNRLQRHKPGYC